MQHACKATKSNHAVNTASTGLTQIDLAASCVTAHAAPLQCLAASSCLPVLLGCHLACCVVAFGRVCELLLVSPLAAELISEQSCCLQLHLLLHLLQVLQL